MGVLRRRMEEELRLRGYSERTVKVYVEGVKLFARFHGRSPEEMGEEEIRKYLLHLTVERGLSFSSANNALCSIRFLYTKVIGRPCEIEKIPFRKARKRLPVVLSRDEVRAIVEAAANVRDRALIMSMYSAGLRVAEASALRCADIDATRMVLQVRNAKGLKDRVVMLSPTLLDTLRDHWRANRPTSTQGWLFPGESPERPITTRAVQDMFARTCKRAGITKKASCHTLRHSFATHLMESGTNLRYIQELLGHKTPTTTAIYTRVSAVGAAAVASPLESLDLKAQTPFG